MSATAGKSRPIVGVGNRAGDAQTAAEIALVALSLATAFGFCRLFIGWSWFPTLALAAVASHLLAIFCRRRGLGLVLSSIASVIGLALFTSLAFYRDSSAFGLPTRETWHVMTDDLTSGWHDFGSAIALVEPRTGFMVAAVFAIWLSAFLADGFGFRAGAGPEMLVAPGILFVFCSALAGERFRLLSAGLWLGCAALAFVLHRSMLQEDGSGWLTSHRRGTITAAARVGATLGLGAIAIALVVGPLLPGAKSDALIDTRNPRSGSRQTISPLVDIQGRIANQSDTELFTVKASAPSYWRLTALDLFDGRIWSSARTYSDATGSLGGGLTNGHSTPLQQDYTIKGLSSIWYPAAFAPTRISIGGDVRYDAETASIVTKSGDTAEGQQYTVESQIPNLTPDELQGVSAPAPNDIGTHYTELPANFPSNLTQLARDITANGKTQYEKALLLQNWFRKNFTYDLQVQRGHGINAIEAFLEQRKGYCEQFAGTFAAFARSLGIPARVAVGFTQGTAGPDGLYHVEGKHAHAWPEVYFTGIGWVPFEPTPTRGAPGDEVFTGVPQQQVGEAPQSTSTTTVAGATTGSDVSIAPRTPDAGLGVDVPIPDFGGGGGLVSSGGGRPWIITAGIVLLVLLVLAIIWILLVPRLISGRWGRRRRAAHTEAEQVLVSWHETESVLARAGVAPRPSETPSEFAARAARSTRIDDGTLERLADHVTQAAYSGGEVAPDVVTDADGIREQVSRTLHDRADLRTKLGWRADPRPLLQPLPGDHERRRHLELVDQ